jgi:hypothetical protein
MFSHPMITLLFSSFRLLSRIGHEPFCLPEGPLFLALRYFTLWLFFVFTGHSFSGSLFFVRSEILESFSVWKLQGFGSSGKSRIIA